MNSTYTCKYNGHEGEPIMGMCLDQQCKQKAQYCNECLVTLHSSHQKRCKSMIKLKQIIKGFQTQINDWFKDEFKKIQRFYEQTTKLLTNEKNRMIEYENNLQNEEFQKITQNIDILKKINLFQESQQDSNHKNLAVKINVQLQSLQQVQSNQESQLSQLQHMEKNNEADELSPKPKELEHEAIWKVLPSLSKELKHEAEWQILSPCRKKLI